VCSCDLEGGFGGGGSLVSLVWLWGGTKVGPWSMGDSTTLTLDLGIETHCLLYSSSF
jgi:hypothetical protein